MNYTIPENFARSTIDMYADQGRAWLSQLPSLLDACAERWALTLLPPYPLSYNYVAPAIRADGTPAVLKIGMPGSEPAPQIIALGHYAGRGMVRLLEADPAHDVFLMERVLPGTPLTPLVETNDEQATIIAAQIMRQLWRPPPAAHPFPTVEYWGRGMQRMRAHFGGGSGPLPARLVEEAEALFTELLASQAAPVLLHGDLHHDNILSATRAPWLAIDPKGVIGEPAYEVGALLRNPLPQLLRLPNPARAMARRVDILADELAIDRARIRGWGLAQAVLSAWWIIEDFGHGWEPAIACAELLAALR